MGDKIKQADGTLGIIANVVTVQQTQEMFNLTVSEAHTYYVGEQGWLVHNADDNCQIGSIGQAIANQAVSQGKAGVVTVASHPGHPNYIVAFSQDAQPYRLNSQLSGAINKAKTELGDKAPGFIGQCGEVKCAQQMYNLGLDPSKSTMISYSLSSAARPGTVRNPCSACSIIMPSIGVSPIRK